MLMLMVRLWLLSRPTELMATGLHRRYAKVKLDKGVYNIELEDVLAGIEVKYIQFKKIKKHKGK